MSPETNFVGVGKVEGFAEELRPASVVSRKIGSAIIRGDMPMDGGFGYDDTVPTKWLATVAYSGDELPFTLHEIPEQDDFMLRKPA